MRRRSTVAIGRRCSSGSRCRGPARSLPEPMSAATSLAWYDELRLPAPLVAGLHETGFDEGEAWASPTRSGSCSPCPRPSTSRGRARTADARLLERGWRATRSGSPSGSTPGRASSTSIATRSRPRSRWAVRLDAIERDEAAPGAAAGSLVEAVTAAAAAAGYAVEALRAELAATPPARSSASAAAPAKPARPKPGPTRPPGTPGKPKPRRTKRDKTA